MDVDQRWLDNLPVAIPLVRRQIDPHGRSKSPRFLSSREVWAGLESAKLPHPDFLAQAVRDTFRRPSLRLSPVCGDFHSFFAHDVLPCPARAHQAPRMTRLFAP